MATLNLMGYNPSTRKHLAAIVATDTIPGLAYFARPVVVRLSGATNHTVTTPLEILHSIAGHTGIISLPLADASNVGFVVSIANHRATPLTVSRPYRTASGTTATSVAAGAEISLSSDGVEWFAFSTN